LLRRFPETNGVLKSCRELNVTMIAYAPLAEGILTGKYRGGKNSVSGMNRMLFFLEQLNIFGERDNSVPLLRRVFSKPRVLDFIKLEPLFVVLEEIAKEHEKTITQVALNWIMSIDPLIIPIPGAKNLNQVKENAGALGWSLTTEEYSKIDKAEKATQ
jgi:aryl-alcohol dehydrogenase-like predicted oxidoreductase